MAEGGPEDGRDIQSLRSELEVLQVEIERTRKQQETKEKLRREIEKAKQELATLKSDKKDTAKDGNEDVIVAFTAVVTPADLTDLGAGQIIVFDKIITNVGNTYDNRTGIFTAPVRGVYVFEMALMVTHDMHQYLEFAKDGQSVLLNYGRTDGTTLFASSSRTVTLELEKDSKVWIRTILGSTPPHGAGRVHGYGFSTFSGWLLASRR